MREREREMLLTHLLCCTIFCNGSKSCLNKIDQKKKKKKKTKTDKIPTTEETVISCFTVNQFQNNFKIIHILMSFSSTLAEIKIKTGGDSFAWHSPVGSHWPAWANEHLKYSKYRKTQNMHQILCSNC